MTNFLRDRVDEHNAGKRRIEREMRSTEEPRGRAGFTLGEVLPDPGLSTEQQIQQEDFRGALDAWQRHLASDDQALVDALYDEKTKRAAARRVGMGPTTFYYHLQKLASSAEENGLRSHLQD